MPRRKRTLVCFTTGTGQEVAFRASATRASPPCQNKFVEKKNVGKEEVEVLEALTAEDSTRTPRLLYADPVKKSGKRDVTMTNVGTSLSDTPGLSHVLSEHRKKLRRDLTTALSALQRVGYRHDDLAKRGRILANITWNGEHFYVIDFGKVAKTRRWNVGTTVRRIMKDLQGD